MTQETEIIKNAFVTEHIPTELINRVTNWFVVRKFSDGNPLKQYLKLREETEEILYSLRLKNDGSESEEDIIGLKNEFIDGIGDTLVVIIGILTQTMKGKNMDYIHLHPALVDGETIERAKSNILEVSDRYTKYRIDLEKTYPELYITCSIDDIRSRATTYIFDKGVGFESVVEFTAIVINSLRDVLTLGSVYFGDPKLKDMTLEDCLEVAYDEIKDRKGMMRDGLFVKEANLTPEELAELGA